MGDRRAATGGAGAELAGGVTRGARRCGAGRAGHTAVPAEPAAPAGGLAEGRPGGGRPRAGGAWAGGARIRDPVDGRLVVVPGAPAAVGAAAGHGPDLFGWEGAGAGAVDRWPGNGPDASDGLARADGVVLRDGVRLTDPHRTAVDCARFLPRYPALGALDAFAHAGIGIGDLRRRYARLPAGAPGRAQVAELLTLANWRAQSPAESWARLLVVDSGLPRPWSQVPVDCPGGPFYLDLGYPRYRTGVEYDGEDHHTTAHQREHDRRRRELLRAAGWDVLVVTRQDIHARPQPFLRSLFEVLLIHGWRAPDRRLLGIERRIRRIAVQSRFRAGPAEPGP